MDISVVIPLFNEDESLPELEAWIRRVMEENKYSYEIIFIDDGSTDKSWEIVEGLAKENTSVRAIKFRRNYGKSAGLSEGFEAAQGDVVITMDADMQDSPDEIPGLYKMIKEEGFDLVSGWKKKRYDPIMKTVPSKFFNACTRMVSGIYLHDFNCGLKAYRLQVVKSIEVYGEMHRYIPLLAKWAGFKKIGEKVVEHRARKYGITKFGLERFVNGFLDLMSITFVGRFGKRPMHLLGLIGFTMFGLGIGIIFYLTIAKLFLHAYSIHDRPLFFYGLFFAIIGAQFFLAGFLAELVARNDPNRNVYQVEKNIGLQDSRDKS